MPKWYVRGVLTATLLATVVLHAVPLAAQTPSADVPAGIPTDASSIAAELARQVGVLAADSFRGRTTPSDALERTANYVASEFERLGLVPRPAEENRGQWIQRYAVPGDLSVDPATTTISLTVLDSAMQNRLAHGTNGTQDRQDVRSALDKGGTPTDTVRLRSTAYFVMPMMPRQPLAVDGESWATVVVAGPPVSDSAAVERLADQVAGKSVLYVPPAGLDSAAQARMITQLAAATGLGVLVLAADDSATFAARWQAAQARLPQVIDYILQNALRPHGWVAYAWPGALADVLAGAKLDLAALRASRTSVVRAVPTLKVDLQLGVTSAPNWPTAPNVLGWLEGRDSTFVTVGKDSYRTDPFVLIMAHMDAAPTAPDSPVAGNTLGVAGVLALAQALSRPEARPSRSVLFLVTSGGATPALAGAHWSQEVDHPFQSKQYLLITTLNLDQLERASSDSAAGDTVWVDGLREVERMATVDWIASAHPELGLTVLDGGSAFRPHSDHFGFARQSRPMLYFHATSSDETWPFKVAEQTGGTASARAIERAGRIIQLVFHVATTAANGKQLPQLSETGRMNFLTGVEHLP